MATTPKTGKPLANRTVRGIRDTIPSGYVLGRTAGGPGSVELLPISSLFASPSFVQSQINKTALTQAALASVPAHTVLLGEGTGTFGSAGPGTNGQLLIGQTSADPAFKTVSGDLTMLATGAGTVTGIQGHPVSSSTPTDGEILRWSAADAKWDVKAEFASTVIIGSDVYTAMVTSLADPEVVLAGGLPVYVKNAAAIANFSDYASGSWTPGLQGGTTAGAPTYSVQTGVYVKVGKLVFFSGIVAITAVGGMTGDLQLTGLPFKSLNTPNLNYPADGFANQLTITAGYSYVQAQVVSNTTLMNLIQGGSTNNAAVTQCSAIGATFAWEVGGCYPAA